MESVKLQVFRLVFKLTLINFHSRKGTARDTNLGRQCAEFQFSIDGHKRSANVQVRWQSNHPIFEPISSWAIDALIILTSAFSSPSPSASSLRLNYPLRMRQWHHMCSSWNGKTGEWQVWLKAERIGRGFHNSVSRRNRKSKKSFSFS